MVGKITVFLIELQRKKENFEKADTNYQKLFSG